MTDQEIADQIHVSVAKALLRCRTARPKGRRGYEEQVVVAYMCGSNQAANFLVRTDGKVTPQQLERALLLAGEKLGLSLCSP